MAREIDISISAKDNFTDSLRKMQSMQTSFRKDLGQLNEELNKLNNNKINLKVDMAKAKNELKDAEKAFKTLGDEANRSKLIVAQTKYDNVKQNLNLVSSSAKQAEKDIRNLTSTMSKADNKASTSRSGGSTGALGALAKAGLFNMVGSSLSGAANAGISSAFGSSTGNAAGSLLGGAAAGAAIGSIVPGVGTAIGAVVGAAAGGITALTQKFTEKDEAFKSVVQSNYELAKEVQKASLANGANLAGKREQTNIAFSTLLGGDDKAKSFLGDITKFAEKTPFEFDQLTTMSKTLLAYGYKMNDIVPLLTKVGDAGSALGMGGDDMNIVATSLGRMNTTGKATLEYLNPLLERGIPVWDYLSKASGKTKQQVQEMVSKGLLPGEKAAAAIADYMGKAFEGNMAKQSETFQGLSSTLKDMQDQMDAAMGEGYNEKRKEGLKNQINYLSGESGTKMKEANRLIGEWKASLDNDHDKAINDAVDKIMASEEYKIAEQQGNKVKMGELLAKAQVEGENNYKASAGYQEQLQSDLALIGKIRENTALQGEYYNTGYKMGQEFSKGLAAGKNINLSPSASTLPSYTTGNNTSSSSSTGYPSNYLRGGYAFGLERVPYDNYPALLHQDEKVLTASQARALNDGGQKVEINLNGAVVRDESDIDKIASAIVSKIEFYRPGYAG